MLKKIILFLLFSAIADSSQAQKVIDKMVKQTCNCLDGVNVKLEKDYIDSTFKKCYADAFDGNLHELSKKFKMEIGKELIEKVQPVFAKELFANCNKVLEIVMIMNQAGEAEEKDSSIKKRIVLDPNATVSNQQCSALHIGTFRYIKDGVVDTTKILVFTKNEILDYENNGKLNTTSVIVWKSECSYVSTMVKTESEEMKRFVKDKIPLEATIMQIDGDVITYNVKIFGVQTLFQLKKMK